MAETTEIIKADATEIQLQTGTQLASYQPSQLLAMAIQKDLDISKLEKLMELQERYERNEAKKAYMKAIAELKNNPPKLIKNKSASFGTGKATYNYASLGYICKEITESLSTYGLTHSWKIEQDDMKSIKVTCTLTHELGHSESTSLMAYPDQSGNKNAIQAIASAVSYLERYTLLAVTGFAADDIDDDGQAFANTGNGTQQQKPGTQAQTKKTEATGKKAEPKNGYAEFLDKAKKYAEWFNNSGHIAAYTATVQAVASVDSAQKIRDEKLQKELLKALKDKQLSMIIELPSENLELICGNDKLWVAYYTKAIKDFKAGQQEAYIPDAVKKVIVTESDPGKVSKPEDRAKLIADLEGFRSAML